MTNGNGSKDGLEHTEDPAGVEVIVFNFSQPGQSREKAVEDFRATMAKVLFGRERTGDQCVACGSKAVKPEDFRDDLSRKEFTLSNFCQVCQDETFGKEGGDV